jgi:hypothetical protein
MLFVAVTVMRNSGFEEDAFGVRMCVYVCVCV